MFRAMLDGFRRKPYSTLLMSVSILLLVGCGESGLLDLYGGGEAVVIESILPGSVIAPGDAIPVSAQADETVSDPAYLELRVEDRRGDLLLSFEEPAADAPISVATEELPPGYYLLIVRALDADRNELSASEVPFFVVQQSTLIKGISAYPTAVLPKEGIVFYAELAQVSGDPYLRWSADGRTIGEGPVSQGKQLISWRVPESEGIYPVTAELFPFPPPEGEGFRFTAAERFKIEAFVSADPRTPRGELGPADAFSSLFHFRGTFDSAGFLELGEPAIEGEPVLAVESGIFGFRFAGGDALRFDRSMIPVASGEIAPFTLHLKGIFSEPGRIFTVKRSRGEDFLRLGRTQSGLTLGLNGQIYAFSLPTELFEAPRYLSLSFDRTEEGMLLRWFLDGRLRQTDRLPRQPIPGDLANALIGGGFSGMLDEFGIYTGEDRRESISDPDLFGFAMRERYGRRLLYARGFDDSAPQEGVSLGDRPTRPEIERSSLRIPAGEILDISLPALADAEGRIELEFLSAVEGLGYSLANRDATEMGNASTDPDGKLTIRWNQSGSLLDYSTGDGAKRFRLEAGEESSLFLRVRAPEGADLLLDSLIILRGDESLAADREGEAEAEEV